MLSLSVAVVAGAQNNLQDLASQAAAAVAQTPENVASAPKPSFWSHNVKVQANFAQTAYSNWAKGGLDNIALTGYTDFNADYEKDNITWKNRLQLDYGVLYSDDKPVLQKNRDMILLESTFGFKAAKRLSYSATFTFMNQFSKGYNYGSPSAPADAPEGWEPSSKDWKAARKLKSDFFAPANITLGLGLEWTPNDLLTINFSPFTGGFTVVGNSKLRANYGMELHPGHDESEAIKDAKGLLVNGYIYRAARFEFGAQIKLTGNVKVNDNFDGATQLIMFSDYLHNFGNTRVNWDNRLDWKLARYFTLNITTSLVYDDTVRISTDKHPEGHQAVQIYEALQFGFTYTFTSKKK